MTKRWEAYEQQNQENKEILLLWHFPLTTTINQKQIRNTRLI